MSASLLPTITTEDLVLSIKTLSSPEWLLRSENALRHGSEAVGNARRNITTIPRRFELSSPQRAAVETRITNLRRLKDFIDIDMSMTWVMKLLLALTSANLSEAGAKARGEAYIIALHDVPTFAVAEACRRWLRAETGKIGEGKDARLPNFAFPPTPPELAQIARPIATLPGYHIARLEALLAAKAIDDAPAENSARVVRAKIGAM